MISYANMKLKVDTSTKNINWKENSIEILNYLPVKSKYELIENTLNSAYDKGIYNPVKLDKFFHLNLVYSYSNLIFTDEERQDTDKLYDELKSSGFMDKFLQNIDAKEYAEMLEDIDTIIKAKSGFSGIIKKFVDDLPANAEAMSEIINNFDPEKYQAVVDFAKAANGGRSIS